MFYTVAVLLLRKRFILGYKLLFREMVGNYVKHRRQLSGNWAATIRQLPATVQKIQSSQRWRARRPPRGRPAPLLPPGPLPACLKDGVSNAALLSIAQSSSVAARAYQGRPQPRLANRTRGSSSTRAPDGPQVPLTGRGRIPRASRAQLRAPGAGRAACMGRGRRGATMSTYAPNGIISQGWGRARGGARRRRARGGGGLGHGLAP